MILCPLSLSAGHRHALPAPALDSPTYSVSQGLAYYLTLIKYSVNISHATYTYTHHTHNLHVDTFVGNALTSSVSRIQKCFTILPCVYCALGGFELPSA